jgi:hypothetical protein
MVHGFPFQCLSFFEQCVCTGKVTLADCPKSLRLYSLNATTSEYCEICRRDKLFPMPSSDDTTKEINEGKVYVEDLDGHFGQEDTAL